MLIQKVSFTYVKRTALIIGSPSMIITLAQEAIFF